MLSVIIPSYKDPYLQNTIDSILENSGLGADIEIIPVLDGYWPTPQLKDDDRVRIVHLGKNRGMREAINLGVRVSRGEYIMRTDEHCLYGPDFAKIILETIKPNWIVTAIRYFLDPKRWEVMDQKPVTYEKLKPRDIGGGVMKFEGQKWFSRDKERKDKKIDETMAMQGSFWIMPKKWWEDVIVELQTEGYGPMYQDRMVNKNTWFAHKHVSFTRTHNYGRKDWEPCVKYAYDTWKDYYEEIRPKWNL
jgi:glycosyltransferase involved in cell wall biosynthesis